MNTATTAATTTTTTTAAIQRPVDKKWDEIELPSGNKFEIILAYKTKRTKETVDGKEVVTKSYVPHLTPKFADLATRAETLIYLAKSHEEKAPNTNAGSNTLDAGLKEVFDVVNEVFHEKLKDNQPLFILDNGNEVANPEAVQLYGSIMIGPVIQDKIKQSRSLKDTLDELHAKAYAIMKIQLAPPSAGSKDDLAKAAKFIDYADALKTGMALLEQINLLEQQKAERAARHAEKAQKAAAAASAATAATAAVK